MIGVVIDLVLAFKTSLVLIRACDVFMREAVKSKVSVASSLLFERDLPFLIRDKFRQFHLVIVHCSE